MISVLILLLCLLSFSQCATFVPVPRTKEDFDAQKQSRLLTKYKSGDIAFVLRHYNDDFMHSYDGLPQVQLLKHISNMDTFAVLVDQTDPDVLAKVTDLSPAKSAIVEPILRAYQEAIAAADKGNINELVEELVVRGPLNKAGRLKFLREHIEAIDDEVLGRFPPALIKKLMVDTERLDGVIQSNFLKWINDLPYFTEINVWPRILVDAIHKLCSEELPNMPLIERLLEEAWPIIFDKLKSIQLIAKKVEGLIVKDKLLKEMLRNYSWQNFNQIEMLLNLKPSMGILLAYLSSPGNSDSVNALLDAATPAQLYRLSLMPESRFFPFINKLLQERFNRTGREADLLLSTGPWASQDVVGHIGRFLGANSTAIGGSKSLHGTIQPKSAKTVHEEALIKLVRSGADYAAIIAFLTEHDLLKNCNALIAYANEVGPDFDFRIMTAFIKAQDARLYGFSSKMAAVLYKIRSPMLIHYLGWWLPLKHRSVAYWLEFLRTTTVSIYGVRFSYGFGYSESLLAYRFPKVLRDRAGSFLKAAKAGNLEAVKAAFDQCVPYLHPRIIEQAHELAEGHAECREYLGRHIAYGSSEHEYYFNLWLEASKKGNASYAAGQFLNSLASIPIAAQQDLIVKLFESKFNLDSEITIPHFVWNFNAKRAIKWFDLKAVEVLAFRCRSFGLTAEHEFMKTLLELRPDLKLVEMAAEKEKLALEEEDVRVEKESGQATQAASLAVVEE